jgi:hypothetical protein
VGGPGLLRQDYTLALARDQGVMCGGSPLPVVPGALIQSIMTRIQRGTHANHENLSHSMGTQRERASEVPAAAERVLPRGRCGDTKRNDTHSDTQIMKNHQIAWEGKGSGRAHFQRSL